MLSYIKGKITGFRNKIKILSSRAVYNYTIWNYSKYYKGTWLCNWHFTLSILR
jgi:hypothetical protein